MRHRLLTALAILSMSVGSHAANAAPVRWSGNGHFYDVITVEIDWSAAKLAAEASSFRGVPGYLATITSADENLFLTNTFGAPALDGHWIGGFQALGSPEPAGGWAWETGEPFVFSNWCRAPLACLEPNNNSGTPGENEDRITFAHGVIANGHAWNDLPGTARNRGYVVEFDVPPVAPACASAAPIAVPFTSTSAEIAPGEVDFYAVSLRAGEILNIDVDAAVLGSPLDPMVAVFDADCTQLALNDDDEESLDSFLHFTAPSTGTVFIGVTSYADFDFVGGPEAFSSGPYRLSVRPVRFSGHAREVGFARGGSLRMVGSFTLDRPIDLSACPAAATITQLLWEDAGGGELVSDIPLVLDADCRNTPTTARYTTPVGAIPRATLTIGAHGGRFTFRLAIDDATIAVPALCTTTSLTTTVTIDDGTNPPARVAGAPAWTCFGRDDRYLTTTP
jgi:hypothetical protein